LGTGLQSDHRFELTRPQQLSIPEFSEIRSERAQARKRAGNALGVELEGIN
jgi:hypothetical protein